MSPTAASVAQNMTSRRSIVAFAAFSASLLSGCATEDSTIEIPQGAWVELNRDPSGIVYIDSSMKKDGDLRRIRVLYERYEQSYFKVSSSMGVVSVDCKEKKTRVLSNRDYMGHMGSGEVLESNNAAEDWEQPEQSSVNANLIDRLCAM